MIAEEEIKETPVALPVMFNLQKPGTLLMMLQVAALTQSHSNHALLARRAGGGSHRCSFHAKQLWMEGTMHPARMALPLPWFSRGHGSLHICIAICLCTLPDSPPRRSPPLTCNVIHDERVTSIPTIPAVSRAACNTISSQGAVSIREKWGRRERAQGYNTAQGSPGRRRGPACSAQAPDKGPFPCHPPL